MVAVGGFEPPPVQLMRLLPCRWATPHERGHWYRPSDSNRDCTRSERVASAVERGRRCSPAVIRTPIRGLTIRRLALKRPGNGGVCRNRTDICCLQSSGPTVERRPHTAGENRTRADWIRNPVPFRLATAVNEWPGKRRSNPRLALFRRALEPSQLLPAAERDRIELLTSRCRRFSKPLALHAPHVP